VGACYPWWHDKFRPYRGQRYSGGYTVPSFDQVPADLRVQGLEDFVPLEPEVLRANAERKLRELGLARLALPLSLNAYSLARNIASETGSGSAEQKVAMGLSTVNAARRRGVSVHALVTKNNRVANRYGRIHGHGETSSAPYGRFTASSAEPTVEDLMIAKFILDGGAGSGPNDFARGADDQAQVRDIGWLTSLARAGNYWVGHIPGVNPAQVTLFRKLGLNHQSPEGQTLLTRGLQMLQQPAGEFVGDCVATAPSRMGKIFAGVAGALALGTATVLVVSSPKPPRLVKKWLRR
jgi:hypothetical protein